MFACLPSRRSVYTACMCVCVCVCLCVFEAVSWPQFLPGPPLSLRQRHSRGSRTMSLEELKARAEECHRRKADVSLQMRNVRRKLASESLKHCTPWMKEVAMRVLVLSEHNDEIVSKFLSTKKRSNTAAQVCGWFGALPPDLAAKLLEPGDDQAAGRQLAEASKFVEEFRLAAWVKEQNSAKGIAPSASAVLDQAGPGLARGRLQRNRYRWVKRCMHRWGGRRVRLSGSDELSAGEFGQKAAFQPHTSLIMASSVALLCGTHFGAGK